MLKQNEIERIGRYINEIADQSEIDWVEEFFSQGKDNPGLRDHLQEDWTTVCQEPTTADIDLDRMLDKVHHLIREKEFKKKETLVHQISNVYMKVAAILLLPLIIATGLYFIHPDGPSRQHTDNISSSVIHAPMGSRVSFDLPDGTKGWLNGGSSLSYSIPFSKNRKVALEGEAWFDVVHNEQHPFEISAGESKIKVLGTSFNVSAYKEESYVEVVLLSGKVEFSDQAQANKVILKPSERLILHDNQVNVNAVDPMKYKGWTDGKLIFRGDDMIEVARRIERWYDVKVELADRSLDQFSFRATFKDDSLEDVLKLLSMTSPIGYDILPRQLLPDGTYQKEKIILHRMNKKK